MVDGRARAARCAPAAPPPLARRRAAVLLALAGGGGPDDPGVRPRTRRRRTISPGRRSPISISPAATISSGARPKASTAPFRCSARRSAATRIMPKLMRASPIAICCCANMPACPDATLIRAPARSRARAGARRRPRRRPCGSGLRDLLLRPQFRTPAWPASAERSRSIPPRRARIIGMRPRSTMPAGFRRALDQINAAQRLEPQSQCDPGRQGADSVFGGHANEAAALLRQMEAADPDYLSPHAYLADIHLAQGDYPAYLAEERIAARLSGSADRASVGGGGGAGLCGRRRAGDVRCDAGPATRALRGRARACLHSCHHLCACRPAARRHCARSPWRSAIATPIWSACVSIRASPASMTRRISSASRSAWAGG